MQKFSIRAQFIFPTLLFLFWRRSKISTQDLQISGKSSDAETFLICEFWRQILEPFQKLRLLLSQEQKETDGFLFLRMTCQKRHTMPWCDSRLTRECALERWSQIDTCSRRLTAFTTAAIIWYSSSKFLERRCALLSGDKIYDPGRKRFFRFRW